MLKLICTSPIFCFATTTKSAYIIKKGAYLVPAPPPRSLSGYNLYFRDEAAKRSNYKVEKDAPEIAKKWKTYPELKVQYNAIAKEKNVGYQELKEEYIKNYVVPFKKLTGQNLRFAALFKEGKLKITKGKGIKNIGEQVKQEFKKPRSLEEDAKLQAEADKVMEERKAIKKAFEFPPKPYISLRAYKNKHSVPDSQKGDDYKKKMEQGFNAAEEQWKADVKKWLEEKKFDITFEDFEKLLKKEARDKLRAKKENEEEESISSDDY